MLTYPTVVLLEAADHAGIVSLAAADDPIHNRPHNSTEKAQIAHCRMCCWPSRLSSAQAEVICANGRRMIESFFVVVADGKVVEDTIPTVFFTSPRSDAPVRFLPESGAFRKSQ